MPTTRGILNNNPGNIRYILGRTSLYPGCVGTDGAFCIFDTAEHGISAIAWLLITYQTRYGIQTIRGAINRWAPPYENNTHVYVENVVSWTGYEAEEELDFKEASVLRALTFGIIRQENGGSPYTQEQINAGVELALELYFHSY